MPRHAPRSTCFNPVLGFYRIATSTSRSFAATDRCFNPVLGFYRIATAVHGSRRTGPTSFQSRAGFLPHRDFYLSSFLVDRIRVSIPCWVSTASRRAISDDGLYSKMDSFNPVLGFYRIATPESGGICMSEKFQSRAGFLPHRDRRSPPGGWLPRRVSIPCWVSTASRQDNRASDGPADRVSIPCWVSTASRQGVTLAPEDL